MEANFNETTKEKKLETREFFEFVYDCYLTPNNMIKNEFQTIKR
jgi:hypothetical protein